MIQEFDPSNGANERWANEDNPDWPWPMERLREHLTQPDRMPDGRWQQVPVRVADLRALFADRDAMASELVRGRQAVLAAGGSPAPEDDLEKAVTDLACALRSHRAADVTPAAGEPAAHIARFLAARRVYRESMHPGDRALMSDIVASQPLQAEITTDRPIVFAAELTEGHLHGVLERIEAEIAFSCGLNEQLTAARKALLAAGLSPDAELRDEQAERLRAALGDVDRLGAMCDTADVVTSTIDGLVAEHQRLCALLSEVLALFCEPDDPDANVIRASVSSTVLEQWRAKLADLTPPPVGAMLPAPGLGQPDTGVTDGEARP